MTCCICLTDEKIDNTITDCCKNKIHTECLINWFIFKSEFICPLCRCNTYIPINKLLEFKLSDEYEFDKETYIQNLNILINSYKNSNYTIIIYDDTVSQNDTNNNIVINDILYFRLSKRTKNILCLLIIPIFYILLFYTMSLTKNHKNNTYIDD